MKRIAILFFVLIHTALSAQPPVPPLWGHRVHDEAHVLSGATLDALETALKAHEDSTSNQIAVLIVPSLQGASLDAYSRHVANDVWKLGQKDKDNGVLLLIAVDDRKMRIETGRGLEGALPDAIARRIIRHEIAPAFRDQDYDRGVQNGVGAIIKSIAGEYRNADTAARDRLIIGLFVFSILSIFTLVALAVRGRAGWLLYAFLIPFYAIFPAIVLGITGGLIVLGVYLVVLPLLKLSPAGKKLSGRLSPKSGWGSGWSSGSGWTGGRSSSGSRFTGGGGTFMGGGASGSW